MMAEFMIQSVNIAIVKNFKGYSKTEFKTMRTFWILMLEVFIFLVHCN